MTVQDRDELLREAGAFKLRAMRLRAFGEEDERWEAVALLRHAAMNELRALDMLTDPPPEEHVGARVEACGLLLEAGDPVSAARQWTLLPPWAFSSDAGASLIARVEGLLTEKAERFGSAWRTLNAPEGPSKVSPDALVALLEEFPGVAEIWWALSVRASDRRQAARARERARRLDAALADDDVAIAAWRKIDQLFSRRLTIELKAERPRDVLTLDLIGRIVATIDALLTGLAERLFDAPVELVPAAARSGSFIIDITARGLPAEAIGKLDAEIRGVTAQVDAKVLSELLALLDTHRVQLTLSSSFAPPPERYAADSLIIDAQRRQLLRKTVEAAASTRIDSRDIPQADDLERVFLIAELTFKGGEVDAETLGGDTPITPRQVSYYRRAAKILGLLTESDELTPGGRLVARLQGDERMRAAVVHFESSACGDAWIRWSSGKTLLDVDPGGAAEFLRASVVGLTGDTFKRRAQTLVAWHKLLVPHHYAAARASRRSSS